MEVTGFHAKRCEFDPEYDADAECVVADLEFREDEPDSEVQVRWSQHSVQHLSIIRSVGGSSQYHSQS